MSRIYDALKIRSLTVPTPLACACFLYECTPFVSWCEKTPRLNSGQKDNVDVLDFLDGK